MPFINLDNNAEGLPPYILAQWQKLALSSGQGDPVCCAPAWNLSFHQTSHPERRIFYKYALNSLLLFTEYSAKNGENYLVPLEDSWLFGQPLLGFYAPELLEDAADIFFREYNFNFPVIVLSGIRVNSPETVKLNGLFAKTHSFYRYDRSVQCFASLRGGLDGWLSRRSANHRAKLRKAARKAKELGVVYERHQPNSQEHARQIFERMLAIEERSWKGLRHCGMSETPSRDFYGALIQRLAYFSSAYVIFATLEGQDIGFIFGGAAGQIYRGQQFSYAADFHRFSIGNLLQLEKIKWLCEIGFMRYDMGPITGPRMEYKEHWTEEYNEIQTWIMRKNF